MPTYELKNNGKDLKSSADVRVGDLKDMEEDDDYYTYAYVAKPDDSNDPAELVYIVKQEKSEYKAISLTVDGTAVSAAAATLKAGETYSYTYTAPDGKLIDTVAGIAAADYTVAADGKSVAISFKVKDKTDIAITLKNEPVAPETRTLTLDSTLSAAKVWSADGKTLIPSSASTAFGTEYQVAEGTTLLIQDSSFSKVGAQVQDSQGNFIGEVKKADFLTLTVNEDMTLSKTDVVSVYAIHVGEGVTLSKVENGSGEVTPVSKNENVWYVKDTDNAQKFTVKTADADAVILVTGNAVSNSTAKTGTKANAQVLDNSSRISADVYLYAASKVTLTNATSTDITSGEYVKVGETIAVAPASGYAGVIDNADVGDNLEEYTVGNADVILNGGREVTLNGVTATVNSKAVTSGQIVANTSDNLVAAAVESGMSVIDTTGGAKFDDAVYSAAAVSADIELSAAAKLNLTSVTVSYVSQPSGKPIEIADDMDSEVYVVPGTVIEVEGSAPVTVTDAGSDPVEVDERDDAANWVKLTVGTVELTIK